MITVYGIKNCDTCKKARKWLEEQGIEHSFHDFRVDGLDEKTVTAWSSELGWETLLNRRGTTWRKLADADRDSVDAAAAPRLMTDNPTLIKRPVFDLGPSRMVGFTNDVRDAIREVG